MEIKINHSETAKETSSDSTDIFQRTSATASVNISFN